MADRRSPADETTTEAEAPRALVAGILATGLAAALVAILTSHFGVQGTVAGAMVGAMGGSALSQVVGVPLDRLERWLVRRGLLVVRRRGIPAARVQAVRVVGASNMPWTAKIGWRVLAVGGLGFLVGMVAISGFELTQGKPLSASTARQEQTGTTVGNLVHPSGVDSEPPTAEPTPGQLAEATVQAQSPGSTTETTAQAQSPGPTITAARLTAEVTRTPAATFTPTGLAPAVPSATPARSTEVAATPRVTAVTPTPGSRPPIPTPTPRPVSVPDATVRPAGTQSPTAPSLR